MEARSVARVGVMAALLTASAWATIPFGPVPFTLQTLVLAMLPAMFDAKSAFAAVGSYVLIGALGLPVFSGFMGGVGVLAGPTGGFLWGFMLGMPLAMLAKRVARSMGASRFCAVVLADTVLLLIAYACGTVQLMAVSSMSAIPALMMAVVPFAIPDAIKVFVGARVGCSAANALNRDTGGGRR